MIWKHEPSLAFIQQLNQGTMGEAIGLEFTEIGPDYLKARMPVDHRTVQPMGLLHGGASAALSETLGSVAGTLCLKDPQAYTIVGIEINANHLRSVTKGFVTGTVKPVRVGRTVQVWQTDIQDEHGRLVCTSRLTVMVVPRK